MELINSKKEESFSTKEEINWNTKKFFSGVLQF